MTPFEFLMALATQAWAINPAAGRALVQFAMPRASGRLFQGALDGPAAAIDRKTEREVARREGAVQLLPVRGVIQQRWSWVMDYIGGTSTEEYGRLFMRAVADPDVKAIVMPIDSPGGSVFGVSELGDLIFAARGKKPIIAQVDPMAASAAYWLATQADEIVVTPSGMVGSVGVLVLHEDISGWLEQLGVKETFVHAGEFKVEGNPFEPLSEVAKAELQRSVDHYYGMFVAAVARGRGVKGNVVKADFGKGRMLEAPQAVAAGMADKVGTLADTLQRFGVTLYPAATAAAPGGRRSIANARRALSLAGR